jgi:hypothetical protein
MNYSSTIMRELATLIYHNATEAEKAAAAAARASYDYIPVSTVQQLSVTFDWWFVA